MRDIFRDRVLLLIFAVVAGCAWGCSTVRITAADGFDRTGHRTWGWGKPVEPVDPSDRSPEQLDLARRLSHQISLAMTSRGFRYAGPEADLLVTPELRIRQRRTVVHKARADQFLASHHFTPSYQIEGLTTASLEIVEVSDLVIVVVDRRRGEEVWRGRFLASFEDSFAPHLASSVAQLMDPFPRVTEDPLLPPVERNVAQAGPEPAAGGN